jgi:hypothetical protein
MIVHPSTSSRAHNDGFPAEAGHVTIRMSVLVRRGLALPNHNKYRLVYTAIATH